ncbi:polyprenyl synthetase family protein [Bacteroides ovatus]|nr:polyprenyl synthetase family protein [Bacteroides ovatus]
MDSISLIRTPIEAELGDFKELFDSSLSSSNALLDSVVSHIRQRNGKMMRTYSCFTRGTSLWSYMSFHSSCGCFTGTPSYCTSLVHDDVVDESSERRGQLSVNAIFNNKVAVLTGDYLLATSLVHAELTNSHRIIQLVSTLGQDLADGELLQLSNVSNHSFSEEVYFDVIRKKTAALFAACTKAAAFSVGVGEGEAELARLLGEYIGICFQIKDDIFDYFDNKEIGKPTGNDMLEGKLTLPALYVLNTTKNEEAQEIAIKVKEGTATLDEIAHLISFIKENGGIEYAVQTMNVYKQKAFNLLASLPDSDICAALRAYLDYVVDREK